MSAGSLKSRDNNPRSQMVVANTYLCQALFYSHLFNPHNSLMMSSLLLPPPILQVKKLRHEEVK